MGLTPVDLERMTLGDAEVLAARLDAAARTIRDALALMRAPSTGAIPPPEKDPNAPVVTNKGPVTFSAAEQAERAKLMRKDLPDDIKKMEES